MLQMLMSACLLALPVPGDAEDVGEEFTSEAADPGDELEARTYECVVADEGGASTSWSEGEVQIYCLAYCEGFSDYRKAWRTPVDPVDKPDGWCRSKAKKYCHRYNLDYWDSCYGERY